MTKIYTGLPAHTDVRVTMLVDFLDKWNGDVVLVKLNGKIVQQKYYNWCGKIFTTSCREYGIDVCGSPDFPDKVGQKLMG